MKSNIDIIIGKIYKHNKNKSYRETTENLLLHLDLTIETFDDFMVRLIDLSNKPDHLLTQMGLYKLLENKYIKEIANYEHNNMLMQFENYEIDAPKPNLSLNEEVKCSMCAEIFFSKRENYLYICNRCYKRYTLKN